MSNPPPDFVASFQCVPRTDIGMRRANNQDSHAVIWAEDEQSWQERGHLFLVADGMGAHAAGELASKLAGEIVPHLYYHDRELTPAECLRAAISNANREIHRRGSANHDFRGMGTTASVLVFLPDAALVGHVGDSRVYRLRNGRLEQLTFDHSLQWELRRSAKISEDSELVRSIPKNVITRSLGPSDHVEVDVEGPFPLQLGDVFLLCSDGLTGQIADGELVELLSYLPPPEAAGTLVDLANLRGGPDNITLIIVRVIDDRVLSAAPPTKSVRRRPRNQAALNWQVVGPMIGVCLLVALVLYPAGQTVLAVLLAAIAVASLLAVLGVGWWRQRAAIESESAGARIGEAPYVTTTCRQDGEFANTLWKMLEDLRQAAKEEGWSIRWAEIDADRQLAERAAEAKRFPEAVRHYADAIRRTMEELRRQPRGRRPDSSVDLRGSR